jgi:WD40 repeat protein
LPEGAVARLGSVYLPETAATTSLAFLPDGKTLAVGSTQIRLLDAATGRLIRYCDGEGPSVGRLVPSADGKRILTWMGSIRTFDTATGKEVLRIKNEFTGDEFVAAALSADGKMASTATMANGVRFRRGGNQGNGMIRLWDAASGNKIDEWNPAMRPSGLAFSPDGRFIAVALAEQPAKKSLEIWDVATGTMVRQLDGADVTPEPVHQQLAFSPDGKILAGPGPGNAIVLWDAETGKETCKLEGHTGHVAGLTWTSDGKMLASTSPNDESVRLWDVETGRTLHTWKFKSIAVAITPDGKKLAVAPLVQGPGGTVSPNVKLFDTASGKELEGIVKHHAPVTSVACTVDGKTIATAGKDDGVRIWDAVTGKELESFDVATISASWVGLSADGTQFVTFGDDAKVRVWDRALRKELRSFDAITEEPMLPRGFSSDGKFAITVGEKGQVSLWNLETGKLQHSVRGGQNAGIALAVSHDGNALAVFGPDPFIRLWDVASARLRTWRKGRDVFLYQGVSGNGGIGNIGIQRQVAAVQLRGRGQGGNGGMARNLAFLPEGDYLVAAGNNGIGVLEVATGESVDHIKVTEGGGGETLIAPAPTGRLLAVASGKSIRIVDLATSAEVTVLAGHAAKINALTFTADGKKLISASTDTTALVWDMERLTPRRELKELARKDLVEIWDRLADDDEAVAYQAMWSLADAPPGAYKVLREWLRPVPAPTDGKHISKLIAELDSDDFQTRTKAYDDLVEQGASAEPAYRRALKAGPSLESRVQLEKLLARVDKMTLERLRQLRSLGALERSGSADAREFLKSLSGGEDGAWLTEHAKMALGRTH